MSVMNYKKLCNQSSLPSCMKAILLNTGPKIEIMKCCFIVVSKNNIPYRQQSKSDVLYMTISLN